VIPLESDHGLGLYFAYKRDSSTKLPNPSGYQIMAASLERTAPCGKIAERINSSSFCTDIAPTATIGSRSARQWRNSVARAALCRAKRAGTLRQIPGGRQWFRLTMRDPGRTLDRRQQGAPRRSDALSGCRTRSSRPRRQASWLWSACSQGTMPASSYRIAARAGACGHLGYPASLSHRRPARSAAAAKSAPNSRPFFLIHAQRR